MHYILIERQELPLVIIGPYLTEEEAGAALESSLMVESIVEVDAVDAFLIDEEAFSRFSRKDEETLEIFEVDRNNRHFFAPEETL